MVKPTAEDFEGLIELSRHRVESAFEVLYNWFWKELVRKLQRIPRVTFEDAEDAAQETMLIAWQKLPEFQGGEEEFGRWIDGIALNVIRNMRKHNGHIEQSQTPAASPYRSSRWDEIKPTSRPGVDYAFY